MKKLYTVILEFLAVPFLLIGAVGVDGKWQSEAPGGLPGPDRIIMVLEVHGAKLSGVIIRDNPPGQVMIEGTLDGNTIAFVVQSPDGLRRISFTGTVRRDQIVFNRSAQGTGGGRGIYGMDGPPTLTFKRVR